MTGRISCWKRGLQSLLWIGLLTSVCGCSNWKFMDSLPTLDPEVRREREIARRVKNDPFPRANSLK